MMFAVQAWANNGVLDCRDYARPGEKLVYVRIYQRNVYHPEADYQHAICVFSKFGYLLQRQIKMGDSYFHPVDQSEWHHASWIITDSMSCKAKHHGCLLEIPQP